MIGGTFKIGDTISTSYSFVRSTDLPKVHRRVAKRVGICNWLARSGGVQSNALCRYHTLHASQTKMDTVAQLR